MSDARRRPRLQPIGLAGLVLALVGAGAAIATTGDATSYRVTQKGRAFAPGAVFLRAGERIEIVNDDGELVHHAYLEHPDFGFDTGEQSPGSKTVVAFPKKGSFTVLCGIHPKMKLLVAVK